MVSRSLRAAAVGLVAMVLGCRCGAVTIQVTPGGPVGSLAAARDAVRRLQPLREPVRVVIADGQYPLTEPVVFTPDDSGTAACPITYEAAPGARPVFTGGVRVTGFRVGADGLWTAQVPGVAERQWAFEQLYVNGAHAVRARTPNQFYHYTVRPAPGGASRQAFEAEPQDIAPLLKLSAKELAEVNVVAYFAWESARLRVASVDPATNVVTTTGPAAWPLHGFYGARTRQRYQLENLRAALDEPGEWYLDRASGILTYKPRPGENPATAEVIAPRTECLLRLAGDPRLGLRVEHLTFRGLSFRHAAYTLPAQGHSDGQAEVTLDAAVMLDGARHVRFEDCELAHLGAWAMWFQTGCADSAVVRCRLHDLGAGGIKIGTGWRVDSPDPLVLTRAITVDNCIIHHATWLHHGGHGVWIGHSPDNKITHNDIAGLNYTGISVGWRWGYAPSVCKRNTIEFNRIHHLGWGVLSDMGGVYTLGPSEGTTVSNNVITDVNDYGYYGRGGWGLYNDEGSTGIVMENNLVLRTKTGGYHLHYGKDLTIRNNIFADQRDDQLEHSRNESHHQYDFVNNIVWYRTGVLFHGNWTVPQIKLARNVYWHAGGQPVTFGGLDFKAWLAKGIDSESVVADPRFVDPEHGDFRLRPDSPALRLGFKPFDDTRAGVYGDPAWVKLANAEQWPPVELCGPPPPPPPQTFSLDFEGGKLGDHPAEAKVTVEGKGDEVGVSDDQAASGKRSLRVVDAPGLKFGFNPHFYWEPGHLSGTSRFSFDIRFGSSAPMYVEWRGAGHPYLVGPSLWYRDGKLVANDKVVCDAPRDTWLRIAMQAGLGPQSTGKWTLTVTAPGGEPRVFADLPNGSADWKALQWLGFSATADEKATFWLDNVKLENQP